jgi:phosphoglycolate phosphatase
MISDYDLIIFDWDGTLSNSINWIIDCIMQVSISLDIPQPTEQECKNIIGLSLPEAMKALFPNITENDKFRLIELYRDKYQSKPASPNDLFKETLPVLTQLQSLGKILAVATGKGRTGLDRVLDGTNTRSFFQELRCADTMTSKPSPHMVIDIMNATNHSTSQTIMIGDSTLDLEMGNNAGVACIGVTTGAHSRDELNRYKPKACISNLNELLRD